MAMVNQEFESAPMGRLVIARTAAILAVVFAAMIANMVVMFRVLPGRAPRKGLAVGAVAPLVVLVVVVPLFHVERSKTARFRIDENCLVLGSRRYPLAGLAAIGRDPEILRWAIRTRGSGGIGAIRGRYWSKQSGKFEAFMTDPEKAVVLRWPDRLVAVSPADPEFFILCARSAAGLK